MYHKLLVYTVINHPKLIKRLLFTSIFYPLVVLIDIPAGQILHHGKCPGILYYRFQWVIADEENVMADIAKPANNTLLNLFIILST